jgi:hypothetical protein
MMWFVRFFGLRPLCCVTTLALAACSTWRPVAEGLDAARPTRLPYSLRVTRVDGSRATLLAPFVRGDSLHGRVLRDTLSIPVNQVLRLEQERFSVSRSAAVVLALPVAFVVAFVIHCGESRCRPDY